jgi:hypothetical protein
LLLYLSDQLRKISFRNLGFIERGNFLSTKGSIFIYPYRLMKRGDFFFIDKNKISSEEAFKATLANVGQQLQSQYKLTTEENLLRVTRVR